MAEIDKRERIIPVFYAKGGNSSAYSSRPLHVPVMLNDDDGPKETPGNEESSQSSTSYVYPVRSLLTGIQPGPPIQSWPSIPRPNSSQVGDIVAPQSLLVHQLAGAPRESTPGSEGVPPHPVPPRSHSVLYPYPSRTAIAGPSDASEEHIRTASDPFSPIIKPIDGQSALPISFTEASFSSTTTQVFTPGPSGPFAPPELDLSAPGGLLSDTALAPPHSAGGKLFTSFEFKPVSGPAVDHLINEEGCPPSACSINSRVSHILRPGIAHVPPLPSASDSTRIRSHGSGNHAHSSNRKPFPSTNGATSSHGMHQVPGTQEDSKNRDISNGLSSNMESVDLNAAGDFFTAVYCHGADESGTRGSEDEVRILQSFPHTSRPIRAFQAIRTPGAIQGFGVMIVVAEDACVGTLAVRQVSEVSFLS